MKEFEQYARYYDLLYSDKDYAAEVAYLHSLLQRYASGTSTILELGCGTGMHAALLADAGYKIHGIDASKPMLTAANRRLAELRQDKNRTLSFSLGDARTYRAEHTFDAVIALFHVVSYQTTNEDLRATFNTAKTHLKPGGVFVFDCWYGPAVLSDRPVVRIKRLEDDAAQMTRIAEPILFPNENRVDVEYEIYVRDKKTGAVKNIAETHHMRYLFAPEVDQLFAAHGMKCLLSEEWMTGKKIGFDTWSVCFVGRR
jgi:SAM-dependent methyltransferase